MYWKWMNDLQRWIMELALISQHNLIAITANDKSSSSKIKTVKRVKYTSKNGFTIVEYLDLFKFILNKVNKLSFLNEISKVSYFIYINKKKIILNQNVCFFKSIKINFVLCFSDNKIFDIPKTFSNICQLPWNHKLFTLFFV